MSWLSFMTILLTVIVNIVAQKPCIPRYYNLTDNSMSCVCNATYCDEIPPLGTLGANQAAIYTSSQSGKRFERTTLSFGSNSTLSPIKIKVNENRKNQTIIGFGGAFTDSTIVNMLSLSQGARNNLIRGYFAPEGIGYTVGRVPIASTDFSPSVYSYDDTPGDFNLTNFALHQEDYDKIPILKIARDLTQNKLKLFASPWSAPGWMKTTGQMIGGGPLIGDVNGPYYQTWANYIVRFFEEYAKNDVSFWGVTMENEPTAGSRLDYGFQAMFYNGTMERDFAKGYWGQALRNNDLTKNLKLMIFDDNRPAINEYADAVFGDSDSNKIVDGVAVHWYEDWYDNNIVKDATMLTDVHEKYPDKFLLYTEACQLHVPLLGSWEDGDRYANNIIQVLNNWVSGWNDWNICLDPSGGPGWKSRFSSPIIVRNNSDEFEKQPMFYALGHISKFIVPDSVVVGLTLANVNSSVVAGVAAVTPSGQKVIVLDNRDYNTNYTVSVLNSQNYWFNLNLEARSFTTIVYN